MRRRFSFLAPLVLAGCVVSADPGQADIDDSGPDSADSTVAETGPGDSGLASDTRVDSKGDGGLPDAVSVDSGTTDTGAADTGCSKPDGSVCEYVTNCGCSAGQKCDVLDGTGRACVAAGTGSVSSPCIATGWCGAALTCRGNYCQVKCDSSADCLSGPCGSTDDALGLESTRGAICGRNCDLVDSSGCSGTGRCMYDEKSKIKFCAEASGSVDYNEVCTTTSQCKGGARFCSVDGTGTTKRCYQWCHQSALYPCGTTGSWTCVPYGPAGYGFCKAT